jgi:hypothetical protein
MSEMYVQQAMPIIDKNLNTFIDENPDGYSNVMTY